MNTCMHFMYPPKIVQIGWGHHVDFCFWKKSAITFGEGCINATDPRILSHRDIVWYIAFFTHINEKVVRVTALVFTGDVEACHFNVSSEYQGCHPGDFSVSVELGHIYCCAAQILHNKYYNLMSDLFLQFSVFDSGGYQYKTSHHIPYRVHVSCSAQTLGMLVSNFVQYL